MNGISGRRSLSGSLILQDLQIKKCEKDCPKEVSDAIDRVNENFSQEVINLYSPQYGEKLLADFEKNNPND